MVRKGYFYSNRLYKYHKDYFYYVTDILKRLFKFQHIIVLETIKLISTHGWISVYFYPQHINHYEDSERQPLNTITSIPFMLNRFSQLNYVSLTG